MQTKNIFFALSVLAAAIAGWFAFEARAMRRVNEEELRASQARREQLETSVRAEEKRVADAAAARDAAQARLAAARAKTNSTSAATKAEPARKGGEATSAVVLRETLMKDPTLQNLQLAVTESKLATNYQPFAERRKLSPEQSAQLVALLRKRGEHDLDIAAVMEAQHLKADDPAIAKLNQQAKEEFATAAASLLGADGFRQFQDYERTMPVREFVTELAGAMSVASTSLNAAQADALVDILANASPPYRAGRTVSRNNIDWDQALAGAQSVLTADQLSVLKNGVLQTRNMDKLRALAAAKK